MEIKPLFWQCCRIKLGDGRKTSLWEDVWLTEGSLAKSFPRLFSISMNQKVSVREVFETGVHALRFRRAMVGG
jgi:hypothetical protein